MMPQKWHSTHATKIGSWLFWRWLFSENSCVTLDVVVVKGGQISGRHSQCLIGDIDCHAEGITYFQVICVLCVHREKASSRGQLWLSWSTEKVHEQQDGFQNSLQIWTSCYKMIKALRQRPSFKCILYYACANPALFTQTLYLTASCLVWEKRYQVQCVLWWLIHHQQGF